MGTYDDSELCKLLLEISLLDSAYQRSATAREDALMDAAKRYRVDAEIVADPSLSMNIANVVANK